MPYVMYFGGANERKRSELVEGEAPKYSQISNVAMSCYML